MILDEILKHKREEVERRKRAIPIARLREKIGGYKPVRDFAKAISGNVIGLIAEVKKASPSAGVFKKDLNPTELARKYESGGAAAISVITDSKFFMGEIGYLDEVRYAVNLPVLRKDFIVDEYQIVEARAHGADAILLIVAALDDSTLKGFIEMASELGMTSLVEVHDEEEVEIALRCDAQVIGINNRDLRTFRVSLETTKRLRPLVPEGKIIVSESGIKSPRDIAELEGIGINAVLIGEALVRSDDPIGTIKWLLSRETRV
jgi:indole-3-glycerol phosphate synthase